MSLGKWFQRDRSASFFGIMRSAPLRLLETRSEGSTILRNTGKCLNYNTAQHPRIPESSACGLLFQEGA